ncbi:hypothetical protein AAF712_006592 [Marasmius tenuissimus]|uniref:Endonuclease/exonuclease/phosphatase domain-containing protein n=1 Tax=Marasmius tenuissimus TaxID=585030 RepID=A0ABR2ZYW9_9AGAR
MHWARPSGHIFNVAITRAQSLLVILGDPNVLSLDPLWRAFMNYIYDNEGWIGPEPMWDTETPVDLGDYGEEMKERAKEDMNLFTRMMEALTLHGVNNAEEGGMGTMLMWIGRFQEALNRQVNDLDQLFGDDWSWIGVGRDDGKEAGEYSPIFFKNSSFTLVSWDSFWLSNTPFEPSKFPGAGSIRICTAARFNVNNPAPGTPKSFSYLNTHLDDQSDDQRKLGASLLLTRAKYEAVKNGGPVFITGDFNSPSTGSDSGGYSIITGASPPVAINATFAQKFSTGNEGGDFKMFDLRGEAPRQAVSKNFATFTGFTEPADTSSWSRIDFVFGGSNKGWKVDGYKVLSALQDDGTLSSDHRPVFADVVLQS